MNKKIVKKYHLKEEVKDLLLDFLGITTMILISYILIILNILIFK